MLINSLTRFLILYPYVSYILPWIIGPYCEISWRNKGLLKHWSGRIIGLCALVITSNFFLFLGQKQLRTIDLCNLTMVIAMQSSYILMWFIRGYGDGQASPTKYYIWANQKQWFFGILIFMTIIAYFSALYRPFEGLEATGIISIFFNTLPTPGLLHWIVIFLWSLIISESCYSYNDFDKPSFPFISRALLLQLIILINVFAWGNSLCKFINNHLHPNIILICVGLCALTALWEMGYELCQYLCLKNS